MRVCILSAAPFPPTSPEGIGNYVYNTTRKLVESGHQVTIVTRGTRKRVEESLAVIANKRVRVFTVPLIRLYPYHVHIHGIIVGALVRSLEPTLDLLHAHSPYVPAVKSSLPIVTTIHTLEKVSSVYSETTGLRRLALKMSSSVFASVESRLFKNSNLLSAVSKHVFDELRVIYKLDRVGPVIGNGVDEKRFVPLESRQKAKPGYILYVGRMDYRKGLFDLMECAKQICEKRPDTHFALVGNGPLTDRLIRFSKQAGIERNIVFHGYVSLHRLIELYQNALVVVIPSYYEGLPTVMLEAMACGIPVVATKIPAHTEVISQGTNGLLVAPRSPQDMAETIFTLLDDDVLREKVGEAARKTVETKYTWDMVTKRLFECYLTAVKEPTSTSFDFPKGLEL
jgi:glycosyltransferase involved in cell wall biosynthesis